MRAKLKQRTHRRAFTLLEVAMVLCLITLISTVVIVSLRAPLERARMRALLDRIESLDHGARTEARRLNQALQLRVDADRGRVSVNGVHGPRTRAVAFGSGLRIDRIRTIHQSGSEGTLRLLVSPLGQSDTYALRFVTPGDYRGWLVVAGATGRCERYQGDAEVDRLFAMLRSASGIDAR